MSKLIDLQDFLDVKFSNHPENFIIVNSDIVDDNNQKTGTSTKIWLRQSLSSEVLNGIEEICGKYFVVIPSNGSYPKEKRFIIGVVLREDIME